ncbi:MAG: Ig-like domain-containing protein, partial [Gemmatimonadota bacterium]
MRASRRVVVAGLLAVACSGDGPGPGTTPAQLVLTASPASATAGVPLSPAVKVSVLDSKGNVATSFQGGVHVALAANPGGATLSGTTTVSATAGVATFSNLMLDKSGTGYTLVVSSNGLAGDTSSALTVVPGAVSAAQSSVSAAPAAIAASTGSSAATVTVTARDAFGNLVPGVTVSLAATGSGNTITPPPGPTDAAGVAKGTLSSTVAGTKTVSATAGGVSVSQTASVVVAAGSAIRLRFVTQPTNAAAGAVISPPLQLEARDVFGNLATSYTGNVTIAIAASPAPGTLSGTKTVPMANGAASFGDLSIDKVGAGYTLQVTASPVLTPDTSTSFDITAGPPAKLAFGQQPTSTTAGATIAPAVTVRILDAVGNLTGSTANVTIAITAGTGTAGAHLSGVSSVTVAAVAGVATFSGLSVDSVGTGYSLT